MMRAPQTRLALALSAVLVSTHGYGDSSKSRKPAPSEPKQSASAESNGNDEKDIPTIDVLEGLRTRQISASAEGTGDGRMTLAITNRTNRKLRVVLPPGLVATSAAGQFGGMGGMMGGGMGGMGGGMGGMGGGMGGMGGGMGGGMMGGRGGGSMTVPSSMGMMMLGRLIMYLVGDRDSWDQRSLMMGMMGGMGGGMGGMGGMGGGMGGMMGGMGGGMRSVPPTSLPEATFKPRQTRHLPTALVALSAPNEPAEGLFPAKGEKLRIGAISQLTRDDRAQTAMKRLAADKAPQTVAQLVMWNVVGGLDWNSIEKRSHEWANAYELTLAREFVALLDSSKGALPTSETGAVYWDLKVDGPGMESVSAALRGLLGKYTMAGLKALEGVPAAPNGPALACRIELGQSGLKEEVLSTDGAGTAWVKVGSFSRKLDQVISADSKETPEMRAARVADAVAEGLVSKVLRVQLAKGPRVKGKETYKLKLTNASPLILNGIALAGPELSEKSLPAVLDGLTLPPGKSFNLPASAEAVERMHLKDGARAVAADLSAL